ncbi:hypothetical protein ACEWBY_21455 [Vibrio parahaemolyticus]
MDIKVLEESIYEGAISHETGAFKKWLKVNHPDVNLVVPPNKTRFDLHDISLIMPVVQLLNEASVLNYINLVLEYANYAFKGSLKSDKNIVSFKAIYIKEENLERREIHFKGSAEELDKRIEKFDINEFMRHK